MMSVESPYKGVPRKKWAEKTCALIKAHPIGTQEVVDVVLKVWSDILASGFGSKPYRIGIDLFPKPQILGFFLHELIPLELSSRHPTLWRGDKLAGEKDLVYVPDPSRSVEIKTSSNPRHVFANRSYGQRPTKSKKSKAGYYLTVNFEKLSPEKVAPKITQWSEPL